MGGINPVYLFADSELLFWADESVLFLKTALRFASEFDLSATYIGVSNGDRPEFYDIFRAAMGNIGIVETRMIRGAFAKRDQDFLSRSNIVLLAGGDTADGWNILEKSGLGGAIQDRYADGAILIGVSAGAIQLGLGTFLEGKEAVGAWIDTFQIVPFVVGVREESTNWSGLRRAVEVVGRAGRIGVGIPAGGGIVYHPDRSLEPVRRPIREFCLEDGEMVSKVLIPKATVADSFFEH